jgi:hypothetical protein
MQEKTAQCVDTLLEELFSLCNDAVLNVGTNEYPPPPSSSSSSSSSAPPPPPTDRNVHSTISDALESLLTDPTEAPATIPTIACMREIAQVICKMCMCIREYMVDSERAIVEMQAKSNERKKYIVLLMNVAPTAVHLGAISIALIFAGVAFANACRQGEVSTEKYKIFTKIRNVLVAYEQCIPMQDAHKNVLSDEQERNQARCVCGQMLDASEYNKITSSHGNYQNRNNECEKSGCFTATRGFEQCVQVVMSSLNSKATRRDVSALLDGFP